MSYIINNSRGDVIAVVADGTVNTSATDLALVGRALTDYGTYENENYVYLLENFARNTAPLQPILGQLWYQANTDTLHSYSSANSWVALATQDYVQAQKISPIFTGVPEAPTAPAGTANTQLATTAFVTNSVQLAGTPTAPTAAPGTNTTQIATTAFVTSGPQLTGVPTAPTAPPGTGNSQLATTAFVTNSVQLAGSPTAPTPFNTDSSTLIATTAFVQAQKISPVFTGTPTAPTAPYNDSSANIATTGFVQAAKVSPNFSGVPTAPTAPPGTSNTQIATTQWVVDTVGPGGILGSMAQQNSSAVAITGGSITGITPLAIADGGTGSTDAATARTSLGIGNLAVQANNAVNITGGTVAATAFVGGTVSSLLSPINVGDGGTGAFTAAGARTNLGLGTMATQNGNNVTITGGTINTLSSPLGIASGGTGSVSAPGARTNLGLGSMATQDQDSVSISGGSVNGLTSFSTSNAIITGGTITNITPLTITVGGTGATSPDVARNNFGAAANSTQILANGGLAGGGVLSAGTIYIYHATNSNGYGTRYISTNPPSAGDGVEGDMWYQI